MKFFSLSTSDKRLIILQQACFVGMIWTILAFLPLFQSIGQAFPLFEKNFLSGLIRPWLVGLVLLAILLLGMHLFRWYGRAFILLNLGLAVLIWWVYHLLNPIKKQEISVNVEGMEAPGIFYTSEPLFSSGFFIDNVYHTLMIQLMLAGLIYAIHYFMITQKQTIKQAQLEKQLLTTKLSLLSNQIEPHFLFNTFNTISALIDIDSEKAQSTLEDLGHLLRTKLEQDQRTFISLQTEIDFIKKYLAIEKSRLQERLQVIIKVTPEAEVAQVPNFLLQPLVENAIRHGISQKKNGGILEIKASRQGNLLFLDLKNDGLGLANKRKGLGLSNTLERLETLYAQDYQFNMKALVNGQVHIQIRLPFELLSIQSTEFQT